jgi:hypothetical protein
VEAIPTTDPVRGAGVGVVGVGVGADAVVEAVTVAGVGAGRVTAKAVLLVKAPGVATVLPWEDTVVMDERELGLAPMADPLAVHDEKDTDAYWA